MRRSLAGACFVAAITMSGIALYRTVAELRQTVAEPPAPPSGVAASEARLGGIREALPRRGTIGYVTDATPADGAFIERFYMAQFALAPLIVVPAADLRWVLGDFTAGRVPPALANPDLQVVRDFGGGVVLFEVPE